LLIRVKERQEKKENNQAYLLGIILDSQKRGDQEAPGKDRSGDKEE